MKILIFMNSLAGGGAERTAATLANYWALRGWPVTVATLAPECEDFYVLDPLIRRVSMNLSGTSNNIVVGLLQNVLRVLALRRIIKQIRPKIVLSMMSTPNVLLAFASYGIANLNTVGSERCYPPHFPLGMIWRALRERMYGRLSAVVALTHECAEWIKMHSSATRIPVIPNAAVWPLPTNSPIIPTASVCGSERKILLAVGRLDVVKNFAVLISVFAEIAGELPDWDLVILGDGPERLSLEAGIRTTMLVERIFVPGIAGNMGDWYSRADLFAMSSLSEGFPNVLAEALAHGLPAVSFDCDTGPRDIIRQGVDGLLVTPGDSAALRKSLECLMSDHELREHMAARANEARERFSIEKIAGMWEDLFDTLSDPLCASGIDVAVSTNKQAVP